MTDQTQHVPGQMTIVDALDAGRQGANQAADTVGEWWIDYATTFLQRHLQRHPTMHTDDLWAAGLIEPSSPRALGAVMQHAARHGWMEQVAAINDGVAGIVCRPSIRSHGQMKAVWRSLLHTEHSP